MKSLQLMYPSSNTILSNVTYLQIGIHKPHNIPITEIPEHTNFKSIVRINDTIYTLTDRDILEFGDTYFTSSSLSIEVLDVNNPFLIIDLAYETAG